MFQLSLRKAKNVVERSLIYSIYDGIFGSCMAGFTMEYFTPFILVLGAGPREVGLLAAIPSLAAALLQLFSADVTERVGSRRLVVTSFITLQVIALACIPLLIWAKLISTPLTILLVTLFGTFGAFAAPAWGSLMSDLVPPEKRGEFFGWRARLFGFITIAAMFGASFVISFAKKQDMALLGFSIIFSCAAIFRTVSRYFLGKMYEPPCKPTHEDYFNLVDFLKRVRVSNFARFVLFVASMTFAVSFCSPFFAVYMLNDLHFSYQTYIIIVSTPTIITLLMITRWGRLADKIGTIRVIRWTSGLIAAAPFFWLFIKNPVLLVLVQILGGFAWSGFSLSASNFIFDACSPAKRTRCIAYFNVLNGVFLFFGASLGGYFSTKVPALFGNKFLMLFLISSILRFLVAYAIPFRVKEVRQVETISNTDLFFSMLKFKVFFGFDRKLKY